MTTLTHTVSHLQKCASGLAVILLKLLTFNTEGVPWWIAFPGGNEVLLCSSPCYHWSEYSLTVLFPLIRF